MNNGKTFWGILFVVLGSLLLLNNFVDLAFDAWVLWKFWPVILILVGIAWFTKSSKFAWVSFAVAAAVIATMIFASAQRGCNVVSMRHGNQKLHSQALIVDMNDSSRHSLLQVNLGAGSFRLIDTTTSLAAVRTESTFGLYSLSRFYDDDSRAVVELSMEDNDVHIADGSMNNNADISLNSTVTWDMDFDVGAASVNFDFTPYILRTIRLDAGAASIRLKFGDRADTSRATLDVGASSIVLLIPDNVGCELLSNMQLSSKHFDGFHEAGEDGDYVIHRTDGFEASSKRLFLTIDGGISSIKIERYTAGDGKDF